MDRRRNNAASPATAALTLLGALLLSPALLPRPARAALAPQTPAAPTVPAAPAPAPAAPVPPSPADIEKTVSEALQAASKAQAGLAYKQAFILSNKGFGELSDKRLDVDLKNTGLHDALKRVLEDAKVAYTIDDDVPSDPKVTLKVANATLPTVLDLLTEANGIGWRPEVIPGILSSPVVSTSNGNGSKGTVTVTPGTTKPQAESVRVHVGKSVEPLPRSFRLGVMDLKGFPGGAISLPAPPASQSPYIRHFTWQERRATFTCPNCHNTVTILRTPEEVHCPTCGRVFEDDWKVCPYDGTKRPARKDEWHYCPICGKPIKLEEQQTSWVTTPFLPRFYVSAADAPDAQDFFFTDGDLIPCPGTDDSSSSGDDTSADILIPAPGSTLL